jgi:transposase
MSRGSYLSASKVKNKNGIPELQIIASFNKPDEAHSYYKERWQIESIFKALKTSGFNVKDTHLTDLDRVEKFFALVLVAFIWACKIDVFLNDICPIKIKKYG